MSRYGQEEARYVNAMGIDLARIFHALWNECVSLNQRWNEFVVLFGTKSERFELMNAAAPSFFRMYQDIAWQGILLHICRLSDKAKTGRRQNLTLLRLKPLVTATLQPDLQTLLNTLAGKTEFARDWRNRYIAHNDFELAIGEKPIQLQSGNRLNVKEAIEAIVAILSFVESHYLESQTAYHFINSPGGAESLLHVIRDGLDAENRKMDRLRRGDLLPEDLIIPPKV